MALTAILEAVVPLFSLIILGFVAGKRRWIDAAGVKTLVSFIFNIAMPALLFRLVIVTDVTGLIDADFLLAYVSAQLIAAFVGGLLGKMLFQLRPEGLVIQGFGSSFPNSVLLGIPLMLALYGERGAVPVTMIFAFNLGLYSMVTMSLEVLRHQADRIAPLSLLKTTARGILANPVILSAVAGMAWGSLGLGLAPVVDRTLSFIAQAGPPTALFALGASLSVREMARGLHGPLGKASLMTLSKLFLHPTLAWVMAVPVFGIDPFLATAAIIIAALPVGANVYIFAQNYDVAVPEASSAVLISTGLSMLTIPILLWVIL